MLQTAYQIQQIMKTFQPAITAETRTTTELYCICTIRSIVLAVIIKCKIVNNLFPVHDNLAGADLTANAALRNIVLHAQPNFVN